ncbi:SigE family RNA polymerase sigma factor [Streptomyces zagrosensis]|uniref:SigE family RNA polymerase sigma factor n=1 Tax=Streptomyces zagrosensis TaxID=1042984 RepID=UPI001FE51ECD|nr:SigE family RNA polymerase sigma factor [Streptomyces zagrosensis]
MSPEEFDAFYLAAVHRVTGQIYAMTGNLSEAEDVVQEAFIRAWKRRAELSATGSPEAWVRTVAWRLAVSRWRRARSALNAWRRHGAPAHAQGPDPERVAVIEALKRLPAEQRRAIVLHHLCDLPVEEVAAETGAPVGTVKARLSRGRAALARQLRDHSLPATTISGR